MPRVHLTADAIQRELREFRRQLAAAPLALQAAAEARPGATPRAEVARFDGMRVQHYAASEPRDAVLLVYALVNRPEMADLAPGRSLIAALLERGVDVYLVDWSTPGRVDTTRSLADYIAGDIDRAVNFLRGHLGREQINLLGICQGGTFSACYAALHPQKVARLILTVTPIDFHTDDDLLSHLVRDVDIERCVAALGNIPGDQLNALFLALQPFRLLQQKYVHLLRSIDDAERVATFVRMERWIFDTPPLAATAALEFARDFYQRNGLVSDAVTVAGRTVRLSALQMPVLNLFARNDHLVPPAASRALASLHGSEDYEQHELPGGHIGVYVSNRAAHSVPQRIADWLAARRG